jgi:uncharacterized protein YdeI (YjbR/CyaY-like superfamily)
LTIPTDLPLLLVESQAAWEAWLERNHAESKGVWLQIAKKGQGVTSVSYAEAVESGLCYGWIDGQRKSFDEKYYLQRFTPRRPKSIWSQINVDKASQLIERGRMKPAGLAEVERAKADGRWQAAYAPQSAAEVPPDLQAALDAHPQAQAFFNQLNKVNRYAFCFRVQTAKKPETRRARIEKFIAMMEKGEKFYP